jgi:hypothetical protein
VKNVSEADLVHLASGQDSPIASEVA